MKMANEARVWARHQRHHRKHIKHIINNRQLCGQWPKGIPFAGFKMEMEWTGYGYVWREKKMWNAQVGQGIYISAKGPRQNHEWIGGWWNPETRILNLESWIQTACQPSQLIYAFCCPGPLVTLLSSWESLPNYVGVWVCVAGDAGLL